MTDSGPDSGSGDGSTLDLGVNEVEKEMDEEQDWIMILCIVVAVVLVCLVVYGLYLWRNRLLRKKVDMDLNAVTEQNDHDVMMERAVGMKNNKGQSEITPFEEFPLMTDD